LAKNVLHIKTALGTQMCISREQQLVSSAIELDDVVPVSTCTIGLASNGDV
jgi:hypothetical protein